MKKIMADWRWEMIFRVTKRCFRKRVRNGEQARDEMVKDVNGQILRGGVEMGRVFSTGTE